MMKHTSEPWIAQRDELARNQPYSIYSQSASTYDGVKYTDDPVALYVKDCDALLIAAAPDLLEACQIAYARMQLLMEALDIDFNDDEDIDTLEAAIAKAEGKQGAG